jgi:hypothetical protein
MPLNNIKTASAPYRAPQPTVRQTQTLRIHCAHLRQLWDHSREESRRVAANAQQVRRESRALVKQWSQEVARARQLRTLSLHNTQRPPAASVPIAQAKASKPIVATARRIPWRRLQMQDLDGPYELWTAQSQEQVVE